MLLFLGLGELAAPTLLVSRTLLWGLVRLWWSFLLIRSSRWRWRKRNSGRSLDPLFDLRIRRFDYVVSWISSRDIVSSSVSIYCIISRRWINIPVVVFQFEKLLFDVGHICLNGSEDYDNDDIFDCDGNCDNDENYDNDETYDFVEIFDLEID